MNIPIWLRRRVDEKAVSRLQQLKVVRQRTDRLLKQQEIQKQKQKEGRAQVSLYDAHNLDYPSRTTRTNAASLPRRDASC